jgi:hypothetical protein
VVGGGGAEVGEGVEVGVGVVAGAGDGAEKEPLAFKGGRVSLAFEERSLSFGSFESGLLFLHGLGSWGEVCFLCASLEGSARALRWGFWRARVRGASLGLASQWADASGRSRCWQAQGFWALSSPPICASCGRTGPARALLPPPEYLGQYPGYRRSGGGSLARAARADCGAGQAALPDETGS